MYRNYSIDHYQFWGGNRDKSQNTIAPSSNGDHNNIHHHHFFSTTSPASFALSSLSPLSSSISTNPATLSSHQLDLFCIHVQCLTYSNIIINRINNGGVTFKFNHHHHQFPDKSTRVSHDQKIHKYQCLGGRDCPGCIRKKSEDEQQQQHNEQNQQHQQYLQNNTRYSNKDGLTSPKTPTPSQTTSPSPSMLGGYRRCNNPNHFEICGTKEDAIPSSDFYYSGGYNEYTGKCKQCVSYLSELKERQKSKLLLQPIYQPNVKLSLSQRQYQQPPLPQPHSTQQESNILPLHQQQQQQQQQKIQSHEQLHQQSNVNNKTKIKGNHSKNVVYEDNVEDKNDRVSEEEDDMSQVKEESIQLHHNNNDNLNNMSDNTTTYAHTPMLPRKKRSPPSTPRGSDNSSITSYSISDHLRNINNGDPLNNSNVNNNNNNHHNTRPRRIFKPVNPIPIVNNSKRTNPNSNNNNTNSTNSSNQKDNNDPLQTGFKECRYPNHVKVTKTSAENVPLSLFYKDSSNHSDGYRNYCRVCYNYNRYGNTPSSRSVRRQSKTKVSKKRAIEDEKEVEEEVHNEKRGDLKKEELPKAMVNPIEKLVEKVEKEKVKEKGEDKLETNKIGTVVSPPPKKKMKKPQTQPQLQPPIIQQPPSKTTDTLEKDNKKKNKKKSLVDMRLADERIRTCIQSDHEKVCGTKPNDLPIENFRVTMSQGKVKISRTCKICFNSIRRRKAQIKRSLRKQQSIDKGEEEEEEEEEDEDEENEGDEEQEEEEQYEDEEDEDEFGDDTKLNNKGGKKSNSDIIFKSYNTSRVTSTRQTRPNQMYI